MSTDHSGSEHDLADDLRTGRGASAGAENALPGDALLAADSAPGAITMLGGFAGSVAEEGVGNDGEVRAQRHWWGAAS